MGRHHVKRARPRMPGLAIVATLALVIGVAGTFGADAATAAGADSTRPLSPVGAAPIPPTGAEAVGPVAGGSPISFDVVLKPRDPQGLSAYATAVSTQGSPSYRHFLSPDASRQPSVRLRPRWRR